MNRLLLSLLTLAALLSAQSGPRREFKKPKLVVAIAIDQFRYDYLNRWHAEYTGGFATFFKKGAVFTNANFEHYPTVTAIGHSTFLTGATPSVSGIVQNTWFDRTTAKTVTSVSDENTQMLGTTGKGASPHRLLVSTVGDELKMAGKKSRIIGISIKDRAAILPSGHAADGAYWFDPGSGNMVSTTWYFPELPEWVKQFNAGRPGDKYLNAEWKSLSGDQVFKKMSGTPDSKFYAGLDVAPFGNELIETFAERAIDAEKLGTHGDPDLLTISFSANDYVGHAVGPDDPMVHDMALRVDKLVDKLMKYAEAKVGVGNVFVVLTADHGVAPLPELNQQRKMPGGRMAEKEVMGAMESALVAKYGEGKWFLGNLPLSPYLNRELIAQKKLSEVEVERTAADAVRALPHIFRVYTREQLMYGPAPEDRFANRVRNGFYPPRSPDVIVVPEPFWMPDPKGSGHFNLFSYDTHVPILFYGPNVTPGFYDSYDHGERYRAHTGHHARSGDSEWRSGARIDGDAGPLDFRADRNSQFVQSIHVGLGTGFDDIGAGALAEHLSIPFHQLQRRFA